MTPRANGRQIFRLSPLLLLVSFLAACTCCRFGPGFSMSDPAYFSEPPYIAATPGGYSLRWRYGTWGFFFRPDSKVVDGQLLFALQVTTSSGNMRYGELPIKRPEHIRALETAGAYWLEPNGDKVRLEVRK